MHICRNGCLNQIFLILFDFPFPSGLGAYAPDYLDEPFNYLDPTSQHFICNYLKNINQNKGVTMIISSHNLELIYDVSSRIILLDSGRIIKDVVVNNTEQRDEINTYFKL